MAGSASSLRDPQFCDTLHPLEKGSIGHATERFASHNRLTN